MHDEITDYFYKKYLPGIWSTESVRKNPTLSYL